MLFGTSSYFACLDDEANINLVRQLFEDRQFPKLPDELLPHSIYDSSGIDMVSEHAPKDGSCSLDLCHTGCCAAYVGEMFTNAKNAKRETDREKLQKAFKNGKYTSHMRNCLINKHTEISGPKIDRFYNSNFLSITPLSRHFQLN